MAGELAGFAGDLRRLADTVGGRGARRITETTAAAAKVAALDVLRADLPGQRLGNLGRRGTKLNVGYDTVSDTRAEVKLRPRGAWVLLSDGAKRHPIGMGRRTRRGRITKRRAGAPPRLLLSGGEGNWVTGPVWHPGMGGRHTLTDTHEAIGTAAVETVRAELARVWKV